MRSLNGAREAQFKASVENVEQKWVTVNEHIDGCEAALREHMERGQSRSKTEAAGSSGVARLLPRCIPRLLAG